MSKAKARKKGARSRSADTKLRKQLDAWAALCKRRADANRIRVRASLEISPRLGEFLFTR